MAASTRSSWMPRSLSCFSTMAARSAANGCVPFPLILFFSMADVHIKPQNAVLVPYSYDGNIFVYVVFHLNYRLCRLREAGDVSKRDVVVDGLLNSDAGAGVIFRANELRINLDAACAKEPLHAIAERCI